MVGYAVTIETTKGCEPPADAIAPVLPQPRCRMGPFRKFHKPILLPVGVSTGRQTNYSSSALPKGWGRGFFAPSFLVLSEYVASAWHTLNQFGGCKAGGVGVYHFVDRITEKGSGKLAERPTSKVGRMPYSGGSLAADTGALWCQRTQLAGDRTVGGSPPNKADCCHSNRTAPEQFGTGYQAVWSGTHYGSQGPLPNDKRGEAPADGGGH